MTLKEGEGRVDEKRPDWKKFIELVYMFLSRDNLGTDKNDVVNIVINIYNCTTT